MACVGVLVEIAKSIELQRPKFTKSMRPHKPLVGDCVHAKVAVADGATCFVTSANLTGRAMDKKIEAGLLVLGGDTPRQLEDHLRSLTDTKVVSRV